MVTHSLSEMGQIEAREKRVLAQIHKDYRWLKFAEPFEREYRAWRYQSIKDRTRPVGASVIILFLMYSIVDYQVFPDPVSQISISLRLFLVCPVVAWLIWASYQNWPEARFLRLYLAAYLLTGLGLCLMIFAAHVQQFWMPYDGLLLLLMGGYFLFGMPFWHIVSASWLTLPLYAGFEFFTPFPSEELRYNLVFLATANVIGMVGVYLLEYNHRTLFLNRMLLQLGMQKAAADSLAKSRFIATASHDLRQPLHALHLMLENLVEDVPEANRALVQKAQRSASQLGSLMGSILDQSRLSFGVVRPEPDTFSLSELLSHLWAEMQPTAQRAGMTLSLEIEKNAYVHTDAHLLERIVRNLLTNAFHHSDGTQVSIRLTLEQSNWRLAVEDDGKGIAEADRQRIFEAFHQGPTGRKKSGLSDQGAGLGLSIVQQLTELLGFPLALSSEPGEGCEFALRIPRVEVESETELPEEKVPVASFSPQQVAPLSVLLVEDNRQACDSLYELLKKWGYAGEQYYDAESALAGVAGCPQLAVVDFHLPNGHTGERLLRQLAERFSQPIQGIIMTADTDEAIRLRQEGQYFVLQKPVTPVKLRMLLERFPASGE